MDWIVEVLKYSTSGFWVFIGSIVILSVFWVPLCWAIGSIRLFTVSNKHTHQHPEKVITKASCDECQLPAAWVRKTQFAGDHRFCEAHAVAQKDWGSDSVTWERA